MKKNYITLFVMLLGYSGSVIAAGKHVSVNAEAPPASTGSEPQNPPQVTEAGIEAGAAELAALRTQPPVSLSPSPTERNPPSVIAMDNASEEKNKSMGPSELAYNIALLLPPLLAPLLAPTIEKSVQKSVKSSLLEASRAPSQAAYEAPKLDYAAASSSIAESMAPAIEVGGGEGGVGKNSVQIPSAPNMMSEIPQA